MKFVATLLISLSCLAGGWFLRPLIEKKSPVREPSTLITQADGPVKANMGDLAVKPAPSLPNLDLNQPAKALEQLLKHGQKSKSPIRHRAELLALSDTMNAEQLKAMAMELAKRPTNFWDTAQSAVRDVFLARWAEVSPKEALAFAVNLPAKDAWNAQSIYSALALTHLSETESAISQLPAHMKRGAASTLANSLAETNPIGALELLKRQEIPATSGYGWYQVWSKWAANDPDAAGAYANSLPDGPMRRSALNSISQGMVLQDPGKALAWAKSLNKPSEVLQMTRNIISNLAEREPQQALTLAENQPARERRELYQGIAQNWAQTDPDAALKWVKDLPLADKQACISQMSWYLTWTDPQKATEAISMLQRGEVRRGVLNDTARRLGWNDPEKGVEWAQKLGPEDRNLALSQMLGGYAGSDPEKAAALSVGLPPSDQLNNSLSEIAQELAEKDPEKALAWAKTLETEVSQQRAISAALSSLADRDPEKAAESAANLQDPNSRRSAQEDIAQRWAQKDLDEALRWANTLHGDSYLAATSAIWKTRASDDPKRAAEALSQALSTASPDSPASGSLQQAIQQTAKSWTQLNPTEAAAWALSLGDPKSSEAALKSIAGNWAAVDTIKASEWIATLPAGKGRDGAARALVDKISHHDPQSAFTWASSIQEPDQQLDALKSTVNAWKSFNPDAAKNTVNQSALPEELKAKLQQELK